jgi:uncharacterized protein HemX
MEESIMLPDWLITTAIGLVGAIIYFVYRQSQGIGEVQQAKAAAQMVTKNEQGKVIELQERRIKLLEQEVKSLNRRVDLLTAENESLHRLLVDGKDS